MYLVRIALEAQACLTQGNADNYCRSRSLCAGPPEAPEGPILL